ncbi:unnamed protein product, partial [Dovyalis caffra]
QFQKELIKNRSQDRKWSSPRSSIGILPIRIPNFPILASERREKIRPATPSSTTKTLDDRMIRK